MGSSDNRGEEGEAAGEEEGEVFANITTTTTTNAIDSDAATVITTTISPVETGQENATTTATEED